MDRLRDGDGASADVGAGRRRRAQLRAPQGRRAGAASRLQPWEFGVRSDGIAGFWSAGCDVMERVKR